MHLAGQSASDRMWRSLHQPRRSLRQSVRVAAFHEQSRKPHAKDSSSLPTPAHPATVTTPTAIPSSIPSTPPPLNPTPKYPDADTFAALPSAALAAALLSLTSPNHGADEPRSTTATVANAADVVTYGNAAAIGERAVSDARLFHAAAAAIARHVYDMDAASLVDVLTAFSRAAAVDVRLGHALSEGVEGRDVEKTATLEGGAVKGQVAEAVGADMVALCCGALSSKVDTLTPPDLTGLAQAVAAMRLSDPQLMAALCSRASDPSVLSSFPAPHLVALLEALARLSHRHPLLFTAAAEQLAATALPSSGGGDVFRL